MKSRVLALVLAPLFATGCVMPTKDPGDPADACHASELQYLVGQPGLVLDGMRFSQELRVIAFGMAVTMDYNPARLNIQLDRREVIERVTCG